MRYYIMRAPMVVLLLVLFAMGTVPAVASGPPLVLNTDNTYPRSTPQETGFQDLILKEAFRRVGREIKIIHVTSERALANANEGIDDGDFVRIAGLEQVYPNLVRVPEPICVFEFAVFVKDPSIHISGWESLKPYDVGIITGWKILEANIVGTKSLTKAKNDENLFELLLNDRVQVIAFDRLQGESYIKMKKLKGVRGLSPVLASKDMYLYLNRRHAALAPGVAGALREMKKDGTHKRLIRSVLQEIK